MSTCPTSSRTARDLEPNAHTAPSVGPGSPGRQRQADLAANLEQVRGQIAVACRAAGRSPDEVTLIAVTKTYPASDVVHLAHVGVRDIGENRDQEAAPKAAEVAERGVDVRWHFVGRLQRNKVRSVVRYADLVHSVDTIRLAGALADATRDAIATGHRSAALGILLQVSVDGDPARGGVVPADLAQVAAAAAGMDGLRLDGVMAVAPLGWPPEMAFARLAEISVSLRVDHPQATVMSAGMSGDLDQAVACGATHVRIGSALLGNRATVR